LLCGNAVRTHNTLKFKLSAKSANLDKTEEYTPVYSQIYAL
jgi:hypothetical protein